jgi:hypothetical protein
MVACISFIRFSSLGSVAREVTAVILARLMCQGWLEANRGEMPVNFGKPFSALSHGQSISHVGLRSAGELKVHGLRSLESAREIRNRPHRVDPRSCSLILGVGRRLAEALRP